MANAGETLKKLWRNNRGFLIFLAGMAVFRASLADHNYVPTQSMAPTILPGDDIGVNKLAYDLKIPFTQIQVAKWADPKRGEVVVFNSPKESIRLVKRVVAVGGDRVAMIHDTVYVNGQPLIKTAVEAPGVQVEDTQEPQSLFIEENAGQRYLVSSLPSRMAMRDFPELIVPEGQYFMMGDNRDNSHDSRYIGTISRDLIIGRADRVLMSLDIQHHFKPRFSRIGQPLRVE